MKLIASTTIVFCHLTSTHLNSPSFPCLPDWYYCPVQEPLNTRKSPNAKFKSTPWELRDAINAVNKLDLELYSFAQELFEQRWQAMLDSADEPGAPSVDA